MGACGGEAGSKGEGEQGGAWERGAMDLVEESRGEGCTIDCLGRTREGDAGGGGEGEGEGEGKGG